MEIIRDFSGINTKSYVRYVFEEDMSSYLCEVYRINQGTLVVAETTMYGIMTGYTITEKFRQIYIAKTALKQVEAHMEIE